MKAWKLVLAALCIAGAAHAASVAPTNIVGAYGHVIWQNAINDTVTPPQQATILTTPFAAESTAVLATSNLRSVTLRWRVIPPAADTSYATYRFAVTVKPLISSTMPDTNNAGVWDRWIAAGTVNAADSSGTKFNNGLTDAKPGEFILAYDQRLYLPSAFHSWNPGTQKWFTLYGARGEGFPTPPFLQIKFRCMGPLNGGKPRLIVDVIGERK